MSVRGDQSATDANVSFCPMSFAQQRLWFLAELDPDSPFYNMPLAVRITGRPDLHAVQMAFEKLVQRHEVLRTTFSMEDDRPVQIIKSAQPPTFTVRDLGDCPETDQQALLHRLVIDEARIPFDLATGPLLRVTVLRLSDRQYVLLIIIHHIVFDRWSADVLVRDFAGYYAALVDPVSTAGTPSVALPPLPIQYADFAYWQRERVQGNRLAAAMAYWRTQLADAPSLLELPTDRPRPARQTYRGSRYAFALSAELSERLTALSRRHGVTLFMTLLAAFQVLLWRYTRTADFCIGTPVANRTRSELEGLIGCLVNTLVLRADLSGDPPFQTLLARVRDVVLGAQAHQEAPFEQVVEMLKPTRDLSHAPLFQVMFALETASPRMPALPGVVLEPFDLDHGISQFDLSLEITVERTALREPRLHAVLEYSTDLFEQARIARMAVHLQTLLEGIVVRPDFRISELPLLPAEERRRLLGEWSGSVATRAHSHQSSSTAEGQGLQDLIEAQALRTPDAVAVVAEGRMLTYQALNQEAERVAWRLRSMGVGAEDRVGLCFDRSPEMIIGLLGILKAGGAYVPLDPAYPRERLAAILDDAQSRVLVVTHQRLADHVPIGTRRLLCLDGEWPPVSPDDAAAPGARPHPDQAAYLLYTSGSTGHPKGVVVPHRAVVNYVRHAIHAFGLRPGDRVLQFASLSFDASAEEIYPTLASGATLVLRTDRMIESVDAFMQGCQDHGITVLDLPTMYWHEITAAMAAHLCSLPSLLRLVIIGGEQALPERLLTWRQYAGNITLLNTYGPTEATIVATMCDLSKREQNDSFAQSVAIGRPVQQAEIYVLDDYLQPAPLGVPGELYIGGAGVARGYWGRPDSTADRFIPDPFGGDLGARLYRTGDLARYRENGTLEFLGRRDHQVKVRGFRIELGEIETQLRRQPGVRDAVAAITEQRPGHKRLVAYAVAKGDGAPAYEALRRGLQNCLPDYMVPTAIVWLSALPVTPTGKVDRRALPPLDEGVQSGAPIVPPRTSTEKLLARIWSEVLGQTEIGLHQNFFELGGDSIQTLQVIARAREAGLVLTPRQFFQHQTIAQLALVAERHEQQAAPQPTVGPVPLSPIQRWFVSQPFTNPHHWNQSVLLQVREPVNGPALEQAVQAIVRHHDALRLRLRLFEGGWEQQVTEPPEGHLVQREDLSLIPADQRSEALERTAADWQTRLHLTRGPMFQVVWFDGGGSPDSRLLLIAHHLVIDGVSWRILLEDLQQAYRQACNGRPITLPAKTAGFSEWTRRLEAIAQAPLFQQEANYWLAVQEAMDTEVLAERPEGAGIQPLNETVQDSLNEADTQALVQAVPHAYRTHIQDVLLTALAQTMEEWLKRERITVLLEGHGRDLPEAELDVSRTVGWFTSLYPAVLAVKPGTAPGEALKSIKEQLRRIPRHGVGYGLLRYGTGDSELARTLNEGPEPWMCFNYLGQVDPSVVEAASWSLAPESVGPEHDPRNTVPHELELNAVIVRGRLHVKWTYSGARFRRDTITALNRRYLVALRTLIAHCLAPESGGYTPSDFPLAALDQAELDRLVQNQPVNDKRRIDDLYPLTPLQQGLLFHTLSAPQSGTYLEQVSCTVDGPLDILAFGGAWRRVIDHYAVLRTGFWWKGLDQPLQMVQRERRLPVLQLDWRDLSVEDQQARFEALLAIDRRSDFDLAEAPLMRLTLIRTSDERHLFLWSHHHLLLDGWSASIILKAVFAAYAAGLQGEDIRIPASRPYREYVAWLRGQDSHEAERFWRGVLSGFTAPTPLMIDGPAEPAEDGAPDYGLVSAHLSRGSTAALQEFAQRHHLTVSTVLQGAWALLLSRYSGEDDVVFGVTVSGRSAPLEGIDGMVGLLINTVPLRVNASTDRTVLEWLKDLFARHGEARQYEHTSLVDIQNWSDIPRGRHLFETLLVFENYPVDGRLDASGSGLTIHTIRYSDQTNYPLTLTLVPGTELTVRLSYDKRRFRRTAIERLAGHWEQLLHAMSSRPEARLSELTIITAGERRQLVTQWNATQKWREDQRCMHEVIEAQVERTPHAVAVVFGTEQVTYNDLNTRANRLARYLRRHGIGPDKLVAVCLERSLYMVTALLAILKTGAAYVPIEPDYPPERIAFMLQDAGTSLVLTTEAAFQRLPLGGPPIICLDRDWTEAARESSDNLHVTLPLRHVAYTMYTSGSTGRPKAAGIPHAGLLNRLLWMQEEYGLSADDRVLQKTPFTFDVSVWEFFWPLMTGARLVVAAPGEHKDAARLATVIRQEGITTLHFVPPMLHAFLDHPEAASCRSLRRVICSGEALPAELQRRFFERLDAELHNLYGPTEASIDVTAWACRRDEIPPTVPIGRPITNTQIYLLDRRQHPVPIGVPGELYIGGVGLARGYHRRPDLTAEKFIPDPFGLMPGQRLYRTGDLARYREDGAIEFLGRLDHQVKIRGIRIELGEIEACLNAHPSIRESIVLAREDRPGAKRLVGYVVPAGEEADGRILKEWLAEHLPDYMVPSVILLLDALPLTANGKVDRRALPAPDVGFLPAREYVAPRAGAEQVLADIWADVLHLERVGVNDDFFELGGDSIVSLQIVARAHRRGLNLTPKDLFEHPTVARAAAVATLDAVAGPPDEGPGLLESPEMRLSDEELNSLLEEIQ